MISGFNLLLLVCVLAVGSEACKCAHRNETTHFCAANYAVHVKVLSESVENRTQNNFQHSVRVYTVETLHLLKGGSRYEAVTDKDTISTSVQSASCGVSLGDVGGEALVCGYVSGTPKRLYTHMCSWNADWTTLSAGTKRKLIDGEFANC